MSLSNRVFLSASVPLPHRDAKYFNTADVIAIRDAIRALTIVVMESDVVLVFGGHPAISPMIRLQIKQSGQKVGEKVVLFQSLFFKREFPKDNTFFEKVILTDVVDQDKNKSLALMRDTMITGPFRCGIFIGGMEGVENEYHLFQAKNAGAAAYPVASTGAAAGGLFDADKSLQTNRPELKTEVSYISLMRKLIHPKGQ